MKLSLSDFHAKLVDRNGTLKEYTKSRLGRADRVFGTVIAEGAIETEAEHTLADSYVLSDGTFFGVYRVTDFSATEGLKSVDALWDEQLRFTLETDAGIVVNDRFEEKYEALLREYDAARFDFGAGELSLQEFLALPGGKLAPLHVLRGHAWSRCSPTKEFPLKLHIAGNDDTSFSKMFADRDDLDKWLDWCSLRPRDSRWFRENMVFTN